MGTSQKVKITFQCSFENKCFRLLVYAYQQLNMQKDIKIKTLNENDISELLNKSINESPESISWEITSTTEHKIFNDEQKVEKGFADKQSRIDFKMQTIYSKKRFYYHIEAKNLKEKNRPLLKRYIKTGIDNFISKKYHDGCLVGYLLEGKVVSTISNINKLLVDSSRKNEVLKKANCDFHYFYYESNHKEIEIIKHFIFDFK